MLADPRAHWTYGWAAAPVSILTHLFDNSRSGNNPYETLLTPAAVAGPNFGLVAQLQVQGAIYSQPLIKTNVAFPQGCAPPSALSV